MQKQKNELGYSDIRKEKRIKEHWLVNIVNRQKKDNRRESQKSEWWDSAKFNQVVFESLYQKSLRALASNPPRALVLATYRSCQGESGFSSANYKKKQKTKHAH